MLTCTVCGRANIGGSKFCELCGASLAGSDDGFERVLSNPAQIRFPHPPSTVAAPHPAIRTQIEMVGKLTLNDEKEYLLDGKADFLIGRSDKMSTLAPDIDLTEFDKEMVTSRKHAKLTKKGDIYTIEDLNSTNFTYLNGRMLSPRTSTKLDDGDVIRIGKIYLVFTRIKRQ